MVARCVQDMMVEQKSCFDIVILPSFYSCTWCWRCLCVANRRIFDLSSRQHAHRAPTCAKHEMDIINTNPTTNTADFLVLYLVLETHNSSSSSTVLKFYHVDLVAFRLVTQQWHASAPLAPPLPRRHFDVAALDPHAPLQNCGCADTPSRNGSLVRS